MRLSIALAVSIVHTMTFSQPSQTTADKLKTVELDMQLSLAGLVASLQIAQRSTHLRCANLAANIDKLMARDISPVLQQLQTLPSIYIEHRISMMKSIELNANAFNRAIWPSCLNGDGGVGKPSPQPLYKYGVALTLTGTVTTQIGKAANGDRYPHQLLTLDRSIFIQADPKDPDSPAEGNVQKFHLIIDEKIAPALRKFEGARVTLEGNLLHGLNGNHFTAVLFAVNRIVSRP